jgi:crotonobetainyl-CoA:carnitine CoA-transferase CaiB-like acyl-CoA transferase
MLPREVIATSLGQPPERRVDKSDRMCPHGFYRCVGDDTWVAIAVGDDGGWARLRAELVDAGIEVSPLEDFAARKAAEIVVDGALEAYAGVRSPWEVTEACRRAGVAAHPVLSTARLLWDEHLAARGFFAWVNRPVTGPGPLPGPIFRMGASGSKVRGYAPLLGEHRRAVMLGLLGLDDDELTRYERDGVFE